MSVKVSLTQIEAEAVAALCEMASRAPWQVVTVDEDATRRVAEKVRRALDPDYRPPIRVYPGQLEMP